MQAMFHDPEDYPDTGLQTALVEPRKIVSVMLEAQVIESVDTVRRLNVNSRHCWFDDEVAVVQSSPSYSYQTCITECRMKVFQVKCGCVPFYYPLFGQHLSQNCHIISLTKQKNSYIYAQKCHLLVLFQIRAVACARYLTQIV
jgi:Amiloride-sensitive sodium channel.